MEESLKTGQFSGLVTIHEPERCIVEHKTRKSWEETTFGRMVALGQMKVVSLRDHIEREPFVS